MSKPIFSTGLSYNYSVIDLRVKRIPTLKAGEKFMEGLLRKIGARAKRKASYIFGRNPRAYTAVWIVAESHAIIHTAPEENWIEVVLAFCGAVPMATVRDEIVKRLRPLKMRVQEMTGCVPA